MSAADGPHVLRRARRANTLHQVVLGAALAILGSLVLLALVYISNDPDPFAEHLLFSLGLALISLISALAQVLVVARVALLWAAARRGHRTR